MYQIVFCICMLIVGVVLAVFGNQQNNDLEAQLSSLWNNGTANPGDLWIYVGIAVAIVGLVLTVIGIINMNNGGSEDTTSEKSSPSWQRRMIREYEAQRKNGVITQEEFEQKCQEIMNS